ncbi:site-specific integrase [Verrucosispora sp. ts21]|uniref:tyrosine-type recombinase/integrase n=1 Tax=Verrucosispora sp. ts21 TaxID=2069341 RepID=UPI0018ED84F7|nr:site-specific integrase [Verrucosispora sp. ts21]
MTAAAHLAMIRPDRESRDRLEILTALIDGPGFDPLFRSDDIRIPRNHQTLHWNCLINGCDGYITRQELCTNHLARWYVAEAAGMDRLEFIRSAPLIGARRRFNAPNGCRVSRCERPAERSMRVGLCTFHRNRWQELTGSTRAPEDSNEFELWLSGQEPRASYGQCIAACCDDLARSPLELCEDHEKLYRRAGRPGGARLPSNWCRWFERRGQRVPVSFDDEPAFRGWCRQVRPAARPGQISLHGLSPLMRAELKWGLFSYTQRSDHTRWWMHAILRVVAACRGLACLADLDVDAMGEQERTIVTEICRDLEIVYVTPSESKAAGYIDFEHFGRRIGKLNSKFDLSQVPQQWLRDLLWDHLAEQLRSVDSPRGRGTYFAIRVAVQELGAFLEARAPEAGHSPALLSAEHVEQFVSDHRRRARDRLPALRPSPTTKQAVVTEGTCKSTFDNLRRIMRAALEAGHAEQIGLPREFIVAFPVGDKRAFRPRSPYTDNTARALADPTNLNLLAQEDVTDRGVRDIWETIIVTGRRAGEVLGLRLDCVEIHNGVPLLWHDQTKVGNYNEAIRIPDFIYQRLRERQRTTIARFEQRYARTLTAQERASMAMFPRAYRNPHGTYAVGLGWFHGHFRRWVWDLDLEPAVPHQARHTLATRLLAAGASLQHIKRYLGHVSERMTEHYAKVALSEIDDVLQHVWVAGPGAPQPGAAVSDGIPQLPREQAQALAIDLGRRSTPTEGGLCTYQIVVDGGACPWNLNCTSCDKFVMTGADLLYWRRKREQWHSLAERAPTDEMADWLHQQFEPTARAIAGLERALAGLGLLNDALALDLRRPQDYFHRLWSTAFRTSDLAALSGPETPS